MTTKTWLTTLAATAVMGVSSGVILIVADPRTFNFEHPAMLAKTAAAFTLVKMLAFLQKSPLPNMTEDVAQNVAAIQNSPK